MEKSIIQKLAESQIQSFIRIYTGKTEIDVDLRAIGYGVSKDSVNSELASLVEKYTNIISHPEQLFLLDRTDLMLLKDQLLNYADEFEQDGYIPQSLYFKMDLTICFSAEKMN